MDPEHAVSPLAEKRLGLVEFVALMATMTSLVALSIDAMLPALTDIGLALHASDPNDVHLIVTYFFIGMAFGQMFFGPFADARGRRLAILVGLIIFIGGTLVCMLADSMEVMLAGRIIQAFGVSGPRIAAMAIIRDLHVGDAMAKVMSFIMMVFILVPMLAPIIGQTVMLMFSWQHIFTLFLLVALLSGSWFFARQAETLPRARRRRFTFRAFFKSAGYILTHVEVMGYTLAMGCIFGGFLAYLSASQTIFEGFYDAGALFPLIFATLAFSIGLASFFNGKMVMRFGMRKLCRVALVGTIAFSLVYNALLLAFDGLPPLWLTVSTMFTGFFFIGILFGNLNAMAMQPLGDMAGLGAAIIGSLSSLFSVPIALFVDSFLTNNLYPIGLGFLVFFSLATGFVYLAERR
ncbi:multidrug effflux MFS transporter [Alteromonas sp. CYL-A6]|uniref:multidrug effflux MFS transporter n=1 Tax=Alteromonas nitratireducens TaxID=3390813 RepID=UPI0034AF9E82